MTTFRNRVFFFICIAGILVSACSSIPTNGIATVSNSPIAFHKTSSSGPTVVFQSGLGDGKSVWMRVTEQMQDTAIFVYDRPGYGDSPKVSGPRDPCTVANELHSLLVEAEVLPPYIMVGHSLGGLYTFVYAKLFPKEVAGLVLLDPTHPDLWKRMQSDAGLQASLVKGLRAIAFGSVMRQEFDDQTSCLEKIDLHHQVRAPAEFLFSGRFRPEEIGSYEKMVRDLRQNWVSLFLNAEQSEIADSGHYIQKEAPNEVVHAIKKIIRETSQIENNQSAKKPLHSTPEAAPLP